MCEVNTKYCEVAVVNVVENVECFRVEIVGSKIADVSNITEVIVSNTSEGTTDITGDDISDGTMEAIPVLALEGVDCRRVELIGSITSEVSNITEVIVTVTNSEGAIESTTEDAGNCIVEGNCAIPEVGN